MLEARPRKRFTLEEFDRMAESGALSEDERLELIDGEIVEMNPIGLAHLRAVNAIAALLVPAGAAVGAHVSVQNALHVLDWELYPDLALLRGQPYEYTAHPTEADVLQLVEVADTSLASDRDVKVPRYARAGIPEVWLVDLVHDVLLAYAEPAEASYRVVRTLRPGDTVRALSLPGSEFPVRALLGRPPSTGG